jgi:hypothetical protein
MSAKPSRKTKPRKRRTLQPKRDIIIHLPIDPSKFEKIENEKSLLSYNPTIREEPKSYSELEGDNFYSIVKDPVEEGYIQENTQELEQEIMNKIKEKQNYQTTLLKDYKNLNKEKRRPTETHIHCWWDSHVFKGNPIGIPYDYKSGLYYIYGNFCSPECAAAHLFKENLSNTEKYRRYEMLHEYYHKITGTYNMGERIELAPDKIILKIFGGILNIEQYRKLLKNAEKKLNVLNTPMISITPILEVENKNQIFTNHNQVFIPIDDNKINNVKEELVLKRSKPLRGNTNALQRAMKLKFRNRK